MLRKSKGIGEHADKRANTGVQWYIYIELQCLLAFQVLIESMFIAVVLFNQATFKGKIHIFFFKCIYYKAYSTAGINCECSSINL